MLRLLTLLCLAVLPTTLQAQDERPKIDPAKREALRERAAEIRKRVEALREELRELRDNAGEPGAKAPRRGGSGRRDLRRHERPRPPRGERPQHGVAPRERGRLERRSGRELPPRMEELRERFREAGPFERRMMWHRLHRLRHARGAGMGDRRELPPMFRRR